MRNELIVLAEQLKRNREAIEDGIQYTLEALTNPDDLGAADRALRSLHDFMAGSMTAFLLVHRTLRAMPPTPPVESAAEGEHAEGKEVTTPAPAATATPPARAPRTRKPRATAGVSYTSVPDAAAAAAPETAALPPPTTLADALTELYGGKDIVWWQQDGEPCNVAVTRSREATTYYGSVQKGTPVRHSPVLPDRAAACDWVKASAREMFGGGTT